MQEKNGKWPLCKIIRRHPTLKRKKIKNNDNNTGNKKIKREDRRKDNKIT